MTDTTHHDQPIIVWIGRFFDQSGYGTAARLHLAALRDAGAPVVGVDIQSQALVGSLRDGLIQTSGSKSKLTIRAVDPRRLITAIVHDRPDSYPQVSAAGRSRLIGYSYWETTSLPRGWAAWMQSMDRVWTSSHFNATAFASAGVPAWMVDIVGHPVDQLVRDVAATHEQLRRAVAGNDGVPLDRLRQGRAARPQPAVRGVRHGVRGRRRRRARPEGARVRARNGQHHPGAGDAVDAGALQRSMADRLHHSGESHSRAADAPAWQRRLLRVLRTGQRLGSSSVRQHGDGCPGRRRGLRSVDDVRRPGRQLRGARRHQARSERGSGCT